MPREPGVEVRVLGEVVDAGGHPQDLANRDLASVRHALDELAQPVVEPQATLIHQTQRRQAEDGLCGADGDPSPAAHSVTPLRRRSPQAIQYGPEEVDA